MARVLSSLEKPLDVALDFLDLLFEDNLVPRLHPSQHVSIDQLVREEVNEPMRLIFPHP